MARALKQSEDPIEIEGILIRARAATDLPQISYAGQKSRPEDIVVTKLIIIAPPTGNRKLQALYYNIRLRAAYSYLLQIWSLKCQDLLDAKLHALYAMK